VDGFTQFNENRRIPQKQVRVLDTCPNTRPKARQYPNILLSLSAGFPHSFGKTPFSFSLQALIALFYHQDFRTLGRTVTQNQIHIQNSLIPVTFGVQACWAEALSESSGKTTLLTQAFGNVRDTAQCRYRRRHALSLGGRGHAFCIPLRSRSFGVLNE
jgi:hypothetical protein